MPKGRPKSKVEESRLGLAFSVPEAARELRISRALIYRLIKDSKIKTIKVGARRLVRREAIDDFLKVGPSLEGSRER
jgi:excisionase family DNA binding protein